MKKSFYILLVGFTLTMFADSFATESQNMILGFIEHHDGDFLRVCFENKGKEWESYCSVFNSIKSLTDCRTKSLPQKWFGIIENGEIIKFDGIKYIKSQYYSQLGLAHFAKPRLIERVNQPSQRYSNWLDQPQNIPLIVTSKKLTNYKSSWQNTTLPQDVQDQLFITYRDTIKNVKTCDDSYSNKSIALHFSNHDIKIIDVFSSSKREFLVGMNLDRDLNKCDGPPEWEWSTFWFYVKPNGEIHALVPLLRHSGSQFRMTLIDVLNFNDGGGGKFIFWVSSYNEDGYVLFYDNFLKQAAFTWSYH